MTQEPTAWSLLRAGLAVILDAVGVVLLVWLVGQVLFGGSQLFETEALWIGAIGALACWLTPGARRNLPVPLLAYVGVALLSAAVHQWAAVSSAPEPGWLTLFAPAYHLVIMLLFVLGAAFFLRTPWRLSMLAVMLVTSISVLAVQILVDRASTNFVYVRGGSLSLPDVAQWGGLHQLGMLLALATPFVLSMALHRRSAWRVLAGLVLVSGLLLTTLINGSRGGVVAIVVSGVAMGLCGVVMLAGVGARRLITTAIVPIVAIGLLLVLASNISAIGGIKDLGGRTPIWRAAARMCLDNPWIGLGPGNYSKGMVDGGYAKRYLPEGSGGTEQAHNMLLQAGAELGVVGMSVLLAVWLWMLRACWRAWIQGHAPVVAFGLLFALFGFLVRSMSENFLDGLVTSDRTRVLIWTLWGAALVFGRVMQSPIEHPRRDDVIRV